MTFTPNFITKVVTTLAILPIIAAPAPANAGTEFCTDAYDGQVCITAYGHYDLIKADFPSLGGSQTLQVACANDTVWHRGSGNWSEQNATDFAKSYCSSRGANAHN
jgi:hypothetical protein